MARAVGADLDALDRAAAQIAAAIETVPEAVDVRQQNPPGIPKLLVELRQDALLRWGFNPLDVLDAVRTAFQGDQVGQVYEADRIFNAAFLLAPELRARPEAAASPLLMAT